jgi:hypothetical protein
MSIAANHSCGDSRLKCVDCSAVVCPSCMIACPVGNRCQSCSGLPKGAVTHRTDLSFDRRKALGCFLFGGLSGWLIPYVTFGMAAFCFALAFWAAGRETGVHLRRGDKQLALGVTLPFLVGMGLGTTGLVFAVQDVDFYLPFLMNIGMVLFGILCGRFISFG